VDHPLVSLYPAAIVARDVPPLAGGDESPRTTGPTTDGLSRVCGFWTWKGCAFVHAKKEGMRILFWGKYEIQMENSL
jgi:hypothetical protein